MQLQMTAPLDIGLEQQDIYDDVFDLEAAERETGGKRTISKLVGHAGEDAESSDNETEDEAQSDVDEGDEEARVRALESELDGLYDAYRQKRNERDAKFRAKEARRDHEKEAWYGFSNGAGDSDDADSDEDEGGWDKAMKAKELGDASSDESSDDSDSESGSERPPKRKAERQLVHSTKKTRLISTLKGNTTDKSTQMWFDQDVFQGVDLDVTEENGNSDATTLSEEEEVHDGDPDASEGESTVSSFHIQLDAKAELVGLQDNDDFEVVPQDKDTDMDFWDADGENEDEIKQARILSMIIEKHRTMRYLTKLFFPCRTRPNNRRGSDDCTTTCQPREDKDSTH